MNEQWPLALRVEAFQPEREGLRKAVQAALEEDKKGISSPRRSRPFRPRSIGSGSSSRSSFRRPSPDYIPAHDTIKAMAGLTKMLYSPKVEQILAELEDYQGTTLGELLSFMQAFNLRFAPANSFRQRRIYLKLYPMLAEQANGSLGACGNAAGTAATAENTGGHAVQAAEGAGRQASAPPRVPAPRPSKG